MASSDCRQWFFAYSFISISPIVVVAGFKDCEFLKRMENSGVPQRVGLNLFASRGKNQQSREES